MSRDVDFRRRAIRSEKRCVEPAVFNLIVPPGEIHFPIAAPELVADAQEFLGAGVALIVRQKISVAVLLLCRTAGDDVQRDATLNQIRNCVHLLDKSSGLHQARSISGDKLKTLSNSTKRAADY